MIRAFELGDHLDTKVSELSTGLRKRAGIVSGLLLNPSLLMLDEPTNAIHPLSRNLFIDLIKQLRAGGRTILSITHDLDYCWNTADRAIILDHQHIVADRAIADFPEYEDFTQWTTLGRQQAAVDFGIRSR